MHVDRRGVLTGVAAAAALTLTGSAVGASPGRQADADGDLTAGSAPPRLRTQLVASSSDLRISSAGRAAPALGESALISGQLSVEGSSTAGSLHGLFLVVGSPGIVGTGAPTSIETHHFSFPGGTIVGTGTASLDDTDDEFVIVGGTGTYAGASGSYAAVQRPLGLGGDGSATYRFTFLTKQGS